MQLLMAFQGFDVCDDGFVLTFYQQIFSNPESVEYNFLYWFSGFVGGVWYKLFEDGGILWFRFLAIIVNTLAFYLTYRLLEKYISQYFLLLSLVMVLFVNDYGFLTFYHNQLTALLAVVIIYILNKAILNHSKLQYILAGFILSFTVFTRVPNAVLYILILAIPYSYYVKNKTITKSIRPVSVFVFGSVLGYLFIYMILLAFGQAEVMKNALLTIVDLGNTEDSSHNFADIFRAPIYNYISIVIAFTKWLFISLGLIVLQYLPIEKKILSIITVVIATVLFFIWFNTGNIYPIYSLCLFASIVLMFFKQVPYQVKLISCMSFLVLITLSLGSAGGIKNSGFMAIWIGLPLFFYLINQKLILHRSFKDFNYKTYLWSVIIAFLVLKAYKIPQQTYFDPGSRFDKRFVIKSNKARGIYTSERRAKIINDLLFNLQKFVKPNDYLMVYDRIPMVHFLTETKPYMYNPWVWIYDYNSFEKKLTKAEQEIEELPIVLQQKFETIYKFSEPINDYMSTNKENTNFHSNERNTVINSFLNRNNYKIVWSNAYFNIYASKN